jgi:hypothetical protein
MKGASVRKKKSFIALTPGREAYTTAVVATAAQNVIKLFFFVPHAKDK